MQQPGIESTSRRNFIKNTVGLAAGLCIPGSLSSSTLERDLRNNNGLERNSSTIHSQENAENFHYGEKGINWRLLALPALAAIFSVLDTERQIRGYKKRLEAIK